MFEQNIEMNAPYLEYNVVYDEQFKMNLQYLEKNKQQIQLNIYFDQEKDLNDFMKNYTNIESGTHILLSINKQLFLSYNYNEFIENCVIKNIKYKNDRYDLYIFKQKPNINVIKNNYLIMERNTMNINAAYIGHDIKSREIIYKAKEILKELRKSEIRNKALENKISKIKKFIDQF